MIQLRGAYLGDLGGGEPHEYCATEATQGVNLPVDSCADNVHRSEEILDITDCSVRGKSPEDDDVSVLGSSESDRHFCDNLMLNGDCE